MRAVKLSRSILPIGAILFGMPGNALASEPAAPLHTIILFGADWCAPCVTELRDLPKLAEAAAPDRLELAWTDHPARLPAQAVRIGVTQASRTKVRELMMRYGQGNSGLPFVVMLRDDGTLCATLGGRLSEEGIAVLRKRCDPAG